MDKVTEVRAVLAPNRRVKSNTSMTLSVTFERPIVAPDNNVNRPDAGKTMGRAV